MQQMLIECLETHAFLQRRQESPRARAALGGFLLVDASSDMTALQSLSSALRQFQYKSLASTDAHGVVKGATGVPDELLCGFYFR